MKYLLPYSISIFFFTAIFSLIPTQVLCQEKNSEPKKARITLYYENINNIGPRLKAQVKTKVDRSYIGMQGIKLLFFQELQDSSIALGNAITDKNGEIEFLIPERMRKILDTISVFEFRVSSAKENQIKAKDKSTEIKRSYVALNAVEEDSIKVLEFKLMAPDSSGQMNAVPNVEPIFYVDRMFGSMKISDEFTTTNEQGVAKINFPTDIYGNKDGKVKIIVKLDDHEYFGTIVASKSLEWGIPKVIEDKAQARELWSSGSNSPWYLVIIVNVIVFVIWFIIAYIVFNLYKMKRLTQL